MTLFDTSHVARAAVVTCVRWYLFSFVVEGTGLPGAKTACESVMRLQRYKLPKSLIGAGSGRATHNNISPLTVARTGGGVATPTPTPRWFSCQYAAFFHDRFEIRLRRPKAQIIIIIIIKFAIAAFQTLSYVPWKFLVPKISLTGEMISFSRTRHDPNDRFALSCARFASKAPLIIYLLIALQDSSPSGQSNL